MIIQSILRLAAANHDKLVCVYVKVPQYAKINIEKFDLNSEIIKAAQEKHPRM